ncbi:hypothetical protein [Streptomyces sp. NBC_00842]|nr:hypothetical protein OH821_22040 [Streptomyces sp. NBC_00842]
MITTAQKLLAYREELRAGGMSPDLIDDLVRDAAQTLVMHNGLQTNKPTP